MCPLSGVAERLLLLSLWLVIGDNVVEGFLDCGGEVFLVLELVEGIHVRLGVAACVSSPSVEALVFVVFTFGRGVSHRFHVRWGGLPLGRLLLG